MKMQVEFSENIPNTTYFRMSDVTPEVEGNVLTVYDGEGDRRGWGRPQVTSTVVLNEEDLVAVHVGFSHKYRGSQGWFFYRPQPDGTWTRVLWQSLPDEDRQRVLNAADKNAPSWAKAPGKLRSERRSPKASAFTALKIVRVVDNKYLSLYTDRVEYVIGKTYREKARPHHEGGYYVYTGEPRRLAEDFLAGRIFGKPSPGQHYAVLEVEAWGHKIAYSWSGEVVPYAYDGDWVKKFAVTYLKPLKVVFTFTATEEG